MCANMLLCGVGFQHHHVLHHVNHNANIDILSYIVGIHTIDIAITNITTRNIQPDSPDIVIPTTVSTVTNTIITPYTTITITTAMIALITKIATIITSLAAEKVQ